MSAATEYLPRNASRFPRNSGVVNFGAIGYGYWGPNVVRNIVGLDTARMVAISDCSAAARARAEKAMQGTRITSDAKDVITAPDVDVVAIVTPVWTHFELAKAALENGKHVFVEKPFTCNTAQAEELINLAARKNLQIMVDHTFLFTGAVRKMKQLLQEDALGKLYYYDSTRVNLGLFQHDVNVIWDLAPHDLSIMDYLIEGDAEQIVATGQTHLNGHEDVAFITLYFPNEVIAHINVNWLSPVKIRMTLIGGQKKMVVWNDLVADEKIRVYDKGVQIASGEGLRDLLVSYRTGDMWAPQVEQLEALHVELDYFADCITNSKVPFNDGHAGLRVVRMLEAAEASIQKRGEFIRL